MLQGGNDRYISAAIELSREVERLIPVIGKIIRKNHKEVYLNVGLRHGYKEGGSGVCFDFG